MVGKNYVSSEQYKITGGAVDSYVPQTKFGRHIVFAPFLIIMALKRSLWDILYLLSFLLSPQTKFGDLLFLHRFLLLLLFFLLFFFFFFFFFSEWTCPTKFSETDDPIFTKLHRKVDPHLKRCTQVLEFSKWPPLPWKPWTYVKIFDLTYIGNRQRDFHKIWHIY